MGWNIRGLSAFRIWILGLISIFGFILFAILFVGIYVVTFCRQKSNIQNVQSNVYQVIKYEADSGRRKHGSARISGDIRNGGYVSYKEGNSVVLLSNLYSNKEYECSANCFCDDSLNEEGIRRSTLVKTGLSSLFFAASLTMAYKLSKDVFQKRCELLFDEKCPNHALSAEINDCFEDKTLTDSNDLVEYSKYYCRGYCLDSESATNEHLVKYGMCEGRMLEKEVVLKENAVASEIKTYYVLAHLHPFCQRESLIDPTEETMAIVEEFTKELDTRGDDPIALSLASKVFSKYSFCTGIHQNQENGHVKCDQIE